MLRDAHGGKIELHAHEARETEEGRMEAAVAIHEEEIRLLRQTVKCRAHGGELSEGEVGWDVGEVRRDFAVNHLEGLEGRRVDPDRDRERTVRRVGDIHPSQGPRWSGFVTLEDARCKVLLLVAERFEQVRSLQGVDEPIGVHAPRAKPDAFGGEGLVGGFENRPTVRADDAVGAGGIGMLKEPRGHGSRCAHVAEGPRDGPAGGHLASGNRGDARLECIAKRGGHDPP